MDASPSNQNHRHGCRTLAAVAVVALLLCMSGCQKTRFAHLPSSFRPDFLKPTEHDFQERWQRDSEQDAVSETPAVRSVSLSRTVSEYDTNTALEPLEPHRLNSDKRETLELSVTEAIAVTLERNKFVQVQRYSPDITSRQVTIADSYFHPLFQMGAQYTEAGSQIANVIDGPGTGVATSTTSVVGPPQGVSDQMRLSQRTRTGGEVWGALSTAYTYTDPSGSFLTLNPSFRSSASVQFSHPFLRGAGRDVAMTQVRISSDMNQAERCQLENSLARAAFETASIYWNLVEARSRLDSRNQGVAEAIAALNREEEKLQLGASSTPEVAAVREQLERFRVNLSLAEGDAADAERRLRTAMGIPREDGSNIVPTSKPAVEAPEMDWCEAVDQLCHRRPDIRRQNYLLQSAVRRLNKADNNLLPDIQGYVGASVTGTEGELGRSWQTLSKADYGSWWAGVVYQRQLGRCADKANYQLAQLNLAQQRASLVLTRDQAMDELHGAYQSALNAWRAVQMTESQLTAASEVLKARREMHELGEISVQDYLISLTQWNQALTDSRTAASSYNSSLIRWEYTQGTILAFQDRTQVESAAVTEPPLREFVEPPILFVPQNDFEVQP